MKHYNNSIRGLSICGNIGAITIAVLGLLGYIPGFGLLGSIREDYYPMAPSTAVSFIILGCCLYAISTTTQSRLKPCIILSATILVSLFGLLEVTGFFCGMDLNFEDSIIPAAGHLNNIPIGRMSPATGGAFFFAGIAVILLILRDILSKYIIRLKHAGGAFGATIAFTGFTFCLSYLYGSPLLYGVGTTVPMALTTALAFMLLGLGIIGFAGRSAFPLCYLTGTTISNYLLRYILPLSILSVITGGIIVLYAHNIIRINPALVAAVLTIIMVFFSGICATLISKRLGNTIERAEKIIAETTNSLRESEEKFRAIFEQSGGYYLILKPTSNGSLIIVDVNESACKFHGYTRDELIGKSFSKLSNEHDKTKQIKQIKQVLSGAYYMEETTHIRKDGTVFPLLIYSCRIQVGESQPLILSAEYDITDLKQAKEEVKQLAMFPDENSAPVMRIDNDGLLLYANNSSLPLLTHWDTSVNSSLPPIWRKRIAAVLKQNQAMQYDIKYGEISLSLNLCPIKEMNYVNIYGHDITDRKLLEDELTEHRKNLEKMVNEKTQELQRANEELKSFSYSVSHDLRAPLRTLDGFSQVLQQDYKDKLDEDGQDSLQRIRNASVKMGNLIDSLLKLSRISQIKIKAERVNLSDLAENITRGLKQDSPGRDVVFVIQPDMIVNGDSALLQIVLDNLLGNAWKFTSKKMTSKIEFCEKKDAKTQKTVYYIKDNGAGFNMAYADKLFGAFQRLHSVEEFEGNGIGLATVKRIIQRHNGRIWAESEENKGAVFYFTLNH